MLASRRVAQLAQCLGFDLTNTLTGNVELFTNLLKGVVGIHIDTETHAQYFGFTGCEAAEYVACRFGIDMNTDHTLEEVGKQFDVTRERIRQIEAKALRKLRHPTRSEHLRSFLDE